MSAIDQVGNSSTVSSANQSTQAKSLGKDEFLKMLLAQLKNQDPTNPMQGTDFAAQLAQFSSLEQLTNVNTSLTLQNQNTMNLINAQSVNLIGQEITARKLSGTAETTINGLVSAVTFKNQSIYLTVNGEDIPFSDVLSVKKTV